MNILVCLSSGMFVLWASSILNCQLHCSLIYNSGRLRRWEGMHWCWALSMMPEEEKQRKYLRHRASHRFYIRQPLLVNELPKTDRWKTVMLLEHIKYHLIPTPITYTCITKYRKTLYKAQLMFDSQINKMGFGPEITFTRISKGRARVSANQQPCALRPKRSRKNLIS